MSDLYRICHDDVDISRMLLTGVLVKVKPCEHGNYTPHIDPWSDQWNKITSEMEQCDGTPEATDV